MTPKTSITELERLSLAELKRELNEKRIAMAKMRIGIALGAEKNHAAYRVARRDSARITMVMEQVGKDATTYKLPPTT